MKEETVEERDARIAAYLESLPIEAPDADDLEALARIDVARAQGDLDEAHTLEEWDEIERREGLL